MLGREIEIFVPDVDKLSPESCRQAIAACIDKKVHAISNAFLFAPIPAMDESAKYKCPYLQGNTQRNATMPIRPTRTKYSHMLPDRPVRGQLRMDLSAWLNKMEETGVWKPKNRKIHIVAEQVGYCQTILKAAQGVDPEVRISSSPKSPTSSIPVQDWSPVIQKIKEVDAGAIMIDHWVAAEYAAFCKQFVADPVPGSIVYLQYGPSQPEFLQLGGVGHRGLLLVRRCSASMATRSGKDFRKKYLAAFPEFAGIMGLVYTGNGYDIVQYLKRAWEAAGDPEDFKANVQLDPRQSLSRRLRHDGHEQRVSGSAALP